jgi:hypothetical protein
MPPVRLLLGLAAAATASASLAAVHLTEVAPTHGTATLASLSTGAGRDHLDASATAVPTPAPTPRPSPAPTVAPAPVRVQQLSASTPVPVPPPPPAATPRPVVVHPVPAVLRNMVTSGDGTLRTGVGVYTDCSGHTPLTRAESAIDTCISGPRYFVGHNVGVFTPLMHMGVGAIITYYDGTGAAHVWRVASVRAGWRSADGVPPPTQADVVAQFQTCVVPDGSVDRILDVVAA